KNQGLALNPSKINGLCGRLLCCLAYEDDVYTENRSELPKIGQKLKTYDGEGTVVGLDVLCKKCHVNINGEVKEYDSHGK
ncbi:MAG TPA: regulatory iron-sulfur-containing complex subunit RicT, partial [Bacilli bacterium]|nr:regulatory iron-sulfur-containing complex subunit RicT [Bacilli bacterium]